jgi:hypothetical protein
MDTTKLQKNAKGLDTFLKVIQKIVLISMGVALGIFLILTIAHYVDADFVIGEASHEIYAGPITLTLAEGCTPSNGSILSHGWILFALCAISAAVVYYALGCIRRILQPITQGNPFYPTVGKDIRKIGYVCIVLGIVENVGEILEIQNLLHNYNLTNLVNGSAISGVSVNYELDLTFLIIFFVVLLLSYIFEYGAKLQQLSDETL